MTHADAAKVLGSAESKIGRIENARPGIRLPDLRALMDAYPQSVPLCSQRRQAVTCRAGRGRRTTSEREIAAGYTRSVR
ncbi:helix-turn-helix domain-containing protein [Streptomyces corynorhini]|uniref:helix-turn-helix domain-containing protein n=1 Tax=Streptomyces corynorhini TaxID=2282652 RepID=UPI001F43D696|nr:helix-turn-helix domain-containing protein [Streptomyces corynorhini]